ncbi:M20/M25/M40 family metallo-hydrolase [Haliangium sp.]|uniref:M20/M25/M40 family metallo-hydrolase n=1 Tax=Haliangium sp. TaxID=2663208 RepID=UPI003D09AF84
MRLLLLSSLCSFACAPPPAPPEAPAAPAPTVAPTPTETELQGDHDHDHDQASAAVAPAAPADTPIADAYREVAARIQAAALADRRAYDKLAYLTDRIGHRLSGSPALEQAVAWATAQMSAEGHDNVRTQKVMVPHWVRGKESAALLSPVARPLSILGLGNSVGTGPRGVRGEVMVVSSFEALEAEGAQVAGKIVLYDAPMEPYSSERGTGYGLVAPYRVTGPSRAAQLGAKAVLVRSLTAHSLSTPHTGTLSYQDGAPKIPAAALTVEDTELLVRLAAAGERVEVELKMGARMLPDAESANVIAELVGRERPEEIVLIGAHLDSWDVGQGAHDDGAGCVMMMHALAVLRELGLRPRRTIRVVLFTNEENGLRGALAYASEHGDQIPHHVMALEADSGGFRPTGYRVQGNEHALSQMLDIVTLLEPVGANRAVASFAGADVMPLANAGVPALGLDVDVSRYFDYHHTWADTLDKVDPVHLAQDVAAVATVAYVIADMPDRFGVAAPGSGQAEAPGAP